MIINAPNPGLSQWLYCWLAGLNNRCTSPRVLLAAQLRYVRRAHGTSEAAAYRDVIRSYNEYPQRKATS